VRSSSGGALAPPERREALLTGFQAHGSDPSETQRPRGLRVWFWTKPPPGRAPADYGCARIFAPQPSPIHRRASVPKMGAPGHRPVARYCASSPLRRSCAAADVDAHTSTDDALYFVGRASGVCPLAARDAAYPNFPDLLPPGAGSSTRRLGLSPTRSGPTPAARILSHCASMAFGGDDALSLWAQLPGF